MKNEGLMFCLEIGFDFCQELMGKIAVVGKIGAIFKVDDLDMGVDGCGFGLLGELNEGMMFFSEVEIGNVRGGSTLDARDFKGTGDKTGEAEGGVAGSVFLVVGTFVGFVDQDEAKIGDGGKKGGAGADND